MFWIIVLVCTIMCILTYGLFGPTDYEDEENETGRIDQRKNKSKSFE